MNIAIIGAGPSGIYAAEAIFKTAETCRVDIFDGLPVPYGLLRYGVAPDHQKIKRLNNAFEKVLAHPDCRFVGNCQIDRDISMTDLQASYDAVIIATGARHSKKIPVPGADLKGVVPASEFVAWYNGYPDFPMPELPESIRHVGIIGCGNVSMDLARLLATPAEELALTDMPDHVVSYFSKLDVEKITIFGRRGPLQATVTPHELEECLSLPSISPKIDPKLLEDAHSDHLALGLELSSVQQKLWDLFSKIPDGYSGTGVDLEFRFFENTVSFNGKESLTGIRLERTTLVGGQDISHIEHLDDYVDVDMNLVFLSVGYQPDRLAGFSYEPGLGIKNVSGAVCDDQGIVIPNLYAVGWAKRGATGVIGLNRSCAKETVKTLFESTPQHLVVRRVDPLEQLRFSSTFKPVSFEDWLTLNEYELSQGERLGKVREKLCFRDDIFRVLKN